MKMITTARRWQVKGCGVVSRTSIGILAAALVSPAFPIGPEPRPPEAIRFEGTGERVTEMLKLNPDLVRQIESNTETINKRLDEAIKDGRLSLFAFYNDSSPSSLHDNLALPKRMSKLSETDLKTLMDVRILVLDAVVRCELPCDSGATAQISAKNVIQILMSNRMLERADGWSSDALDGLRTLQGLLAVRVMQIHGEVQLRSASR
jgi:hypothetical protein